MAKIYTKYRNDKVKKKLEPHAENLNLSPYQERLIKKVHFVNPSDCFDEGLRSTLILFRSKSTVWKNYFNTNKFNRSISNNSRFNKNTYKHKSSWKKSSTIIF